MAWQTAAGMWERLKPRARQFRRRPTAAEALLWKWLRKDNAVGLKFRRQHAIGRFVVDFYCPDAGLVVEVDGEVHAGRREQDSMRDAFLTQRGLRMLRFANQEVLQDPRRVVDTIRNAVFPP